MIRSVQAESDTSHDAQSTRKNSAFNRLWAGSGSANLSDGIAITAAPLLAASLTRDPALIAGLVFAQYLPWFLFTLPSGVLIDRIDRRGAIMMSHASRTLILIAVAVLATTGWISMPLLYAALFLIGTIETVADNASLAFLPAIVDPDDLDRANGRLFATMSVTNQFAGAPLGGSLFAITAGLPFLLSSIGYVVASLFVRSIPGSFAPDRSGDPSEALSGTLSFWHSTREGLVWFFRQPLLRAAGIMAGLSNLWSNAVFATFVLIAQDRLGLGEVGYGVILAVEALGGVAGGLLADRINRGIGPGTALLLDNLLYAIAFFGIALSRDPIVIGVMLVLMAFASMIGNVTLISLRQRVIPDALLGRVTSAYRLFALGAIPLGALIGGFLARTFTLTTPAWVAGFAMLVIAVGMHRVLNNRSIRAAYAAGAA